MNDTKTECWRPINLLKRFNIYQEVILGITYKLLGLDEVFFEIFHLLKNLD
jgi:hypothetical protein